MFTPSGWTFNRVTMGAEDAGTGIRLVTAGRLPRFVLAANAYKGTNSASSIAALAMVPPQAMSGGTIKATDANFAWLVQDATDLATTSANIPAILIGTTPRLSGPWAILPPEWTLLGVITSVDSNGTIEWTVATAEIGG